MANKHIFSSAVLTVAVALILVSCSGLTAAKSDSGCISFAFPSARTAASTELVHYAVSIKATDGTSFSHTESDTVAFSTLSGKTFQFQDIPLHTELVVSVLAEFEEGAMYKGESSPFTLTSKAPEEISVILNKLFSTPYALWTRNSEGNKTYFRSPDGSTLTELDFPSSTNVKNFCWDDEETFWYCSGNALHKSKKNTTSSESITGPWGNVKDIDYDYENNQFAILFSNNENYRIAVADAAVLKTATNNIESNEGLHFVDIMVETDGNAITAGAFYKGTYYCINYIDYMGDESWELMKFDYTPSAATLDITAIIDINDLDVWGDSLSAHSNADRIVDRHIINDIQVVDGTIYILAQQRRNIAKPSSSETENDNQFFSRGAVLRFTCDDDTFTFKGTIGLQAETAETIEVPACNNEGEQYNWESNFSNPLFFPVSWTRAIPEKGNAGAVLLGPQKFLAIRPKKLVIADCGIVYYTNDIGLPQSEKQSRIATVDLESFAISTQSYNADFGNYQSGSEYHEFSYSREIGTTFGGLYTRSSDTTTTLSKYEFSAGYLYD